MGHHERAAMCFSPKFSLGSCLLLLWEAEFVSSFLHGCLSQSEIPLLYSFTDDGKTIDWACGTCWAFKWRLFAVLNFLKTLDGSRLRYDSQMGTDLSSRFQRLVVVCQRGHTLSTLVRLWHGDSTYHTQWRGCCMKNKSLPQNFLQPDLLIPEILRWWNIKLALA